MNLDILNLLQSGNKPLAWLGAVALAGGGTAIVVALYIQLQRLGPRLGRRLRIPRLPRPLRPRAAPAAERPASASPEAAPPAEPRPGPAAAGLAAYRALQSAVPAPPPAVTPGEIEPLERLLHRLRRAAAALEEISLRSGQAARGHVGYETFVTGMDVEYLHRQS